jgi:hypothetical protein
MMTGVPDKGQGSNPRPSDLQSSSLPLGHDNRLICAICVYKFKFVYIITKQRHTRTHIEMHLYNFVHVPLDENNKNLKKALQFADIYTRVFRDNTLDYLHILRTNQHILFTNMIHGGQSSIH